MQLRGKSMRVPRKHQIQEQAFDSVINHGVTDVAAGGAHLAVSRKWCTRMHNAMLGLGSQ